MKSATDVTSSLDAAELLALLAGAGPAVAGADGVDENQVGGVEPGVFVVHQCGMAAAARMPSSLRSTRLGPAVPMCSQTDAAPGPPLKTKVIGRVAGDSFSAGFFRRR